MDLQSLYPKIEFPVSLKTPMIAPLIDWDHSDSWHVPGFERNQSKDISMTKKVEINLSDPKYQYLEGHVVDGKFISFHIIEKIIDFYHLLQQAIVYCPVQLTLICCAN